MYTTTDAAQAMDAPPGEPGEMVSAELTLKRRLGEGEPRAWALAWCEVGLAGQAPTPPELEKGAAC